MQLRAASLRLSFDLLVNKPLDVRAEPRRVQKCAADNNGKTSQLAEPLQNVGLPEGAAGDQHWCPFIHLLSGAARLRNKPPRDNNKTSARQASASRICSRQAYWLCLEAAGWVLLYRMLAGEMLLPTNKADGNFRVLSPRSNGSLWSCKMESLGRGN